MSSEDISDALGIEHTVDKKDPEIVKFVPNAVQPTSQDLIDDYAFTRMTLRGLIERGQECLTTAINLSTESPSARNVEVTATLINQISNAAKDLLILSKTTKEITSKVTGGIDDVGEDGKPTKTLNVTAEELSELLKSKDE